MTKKSPVDKYALYELAVQSPEHHAEWFGGVYKEIRGKLPVSMREDFCGTARLSCEWVKRGPKNTAIGVDLDPEPLSYSKGNHIPALSADQQKRVQLLRKNVLSVKTAPVDMLIACNFSFCIFKDRPTLVRYLRNCLKGLRRGGVAILDLAGGPGMITPMHEKKKLNSPKTGEFAYDWHQKSFDPITHDASYAIHFKPAGRPEMKDAFAYDWRLWTIPEVKEAMEEAGFPETCVYWETEHEGKGTGEYIRSTHGDNAYAWVAYVIGVK